MELINTTKEIITLIISLLSLIGAGIGAFFAIKYFIRANKEKSKNEIWNMIMSMTDSAMREAEATAKIGADKKTIVIEAVKSGCKTAGLDIEDFLDQLSAYIDDTIDFVNKMSEAKKDKGE